MNRSIPRQAPGVAAVLLCALASLAAAAPARGQPTTFRGTILYEKILAGSRGLQLATPVRRPASGIKVEVVASPGRAVLGSGFTAADGTYDIPLRLRDRGAVYVRALAQTENASVVRVHDRSEYSIVTRPAVPAAGGTIVNDLLATDGTRVAGAFNIAVTIWRANSLVRSAAPDATLPRVEVRWDTAYVGGTFFRGSERVAFINGKRGRDSDEYDDHVIAHEYGHFLMATFSRDGSPGGDHGFGEQLDPRLAWSEGWGNFFAGATTGSSRYIDTGIVGKGQGVLVTMDLEEDAPPGDRPGIWSEHSVSSALWDWYDDGVEPGDSVALGFAPLWNAFAQLSRSPDPYLLTYANVLAASTKQQRLVGAVLAAREIVYPVGATPRAREPFPEPLAPGAAVTGTVDSRSTRRPNLWRSSAHYWFELPAERQATLTLKITGARDRDHADLDLYLFDAEGELVAGSDEVNGVGDSEQISRRLPPGYYRVEVRSWSNGGSPLGTGQAHQGTYLLVARY